MKEVIKRSNNFDTLAKQVEAVLGSYPEARNDDYILLWQIAETFYPPLERPLRDWQEVVLTFYALPRLDEIAKFRRRLIRRSGYTKYMPTNETIAKKRGLPMDKWEKYAYSLSLPAVELTPEEKREDAHITKEPF